MEIPIYETKERLVTGAYVEALDPHPVEYDVRPWKAGRDRQRRASSLALGREGGGTG